MPLVFGAGYRSGADLPRRASSEVASADCSRRWCWPSRSSGLLTLLVLLPSLLEEISPTLEPRRARSRGHERDPEWSRASRRVARGRACSRCGRASADARAAPARSAAAMLFLAFVLRAVGLRGRGARRRHRRSARRVISTIFEGETLVAAGKWLAGGALTIVALGSRFTQTIGRLRVAIDAVLDVDNYFADPPNRQPPRARIYSRYIALLAYLREARLHPDRDRRAQPGHGDQRGPTALLARRIGGCEGVAGDHDARTRHRRLAAARSVRCVFPAPL